MATAGPEKQLENLIKTELTRRRAWFVKIAASPEMPRGIPDILACYRGHFIGIEVKRPGRKNGLSEHQKIQLANITKAGGIALVVNDFDKFIVELNSLENNLNDTNR
jgi:hypothetical protein|nr:MAG TPA: Nuclease [Caudoviricetes sp.]